MWLIYFLVLMLIVLMLAILGIIKKQLGTIWPPFRKNEPSVPLLSIAPTYIHPATPYPKQGTAMMGK